MSCVLLTLTHAQVLRRTEVNEIRVIEQSPLETALLEVNAKKVELEILERRYLAASQVEGAKVNTNVLSMTLNSVVDTGDAGIPLYRKSASPLNVVDRC